MARLAHPSCSQATPTSSGEKEELLAKWTLGETADEVRPAVAGRSIDGSIN